MNEVRQLCALSHPLSQPYVFEWRVTVIRRSIGRQLWLVLLMVAAFVMMAESAEYRNFTNEAGKVIYARVIKHDAEGGRVLLELRNRKKAWVRLSDLSESDQAYILNLQNPTDVKPNKPQERQSTTKTESLSRKQIEAIADEYIEALKMKDAEACKRLFYTSAWRRAFNTSVLDSFKTLRPGKIDGNNIYVTFSLYADIEKSGWVQLTPDGKIKYCPLLAPHPVEDVTESLRLTFFNVDRYDQRDVTHAGWFIKNKQQTGIPLFDISPDMTKSEFRDTLDEIRDWLIENGATHDNSEPRLFLPEKQMRLIISKLKSF